MKILGFTLAEILITLGIIGVVAAMTLPTLIQRKTNKALEVSLRKNYTIIEQAILQFSYDLGEPVKGGGFDTRSFYKPFSKYFNIVKVCDASKCTGMGGVNEEGNYDIFQFDKYKTFNLKKTVSTDRFDDGQWVVSDGTLYMIDNGAGSSELFISVDVNGYQKGPNAWGHDLFTFQVMPNGKVLPMGAEGTRYKGQLQFCSTTSTRSDNGIGCTYRALYDKNYWKNLP